MRVLHTPPRFYPYIGGVERLCLDLCQSQVRAGHSVTVLCASAEGSDRCARHDGMSVIKLRHWFHIAGTPVTVRLPFCLLRQRYDVLHTYLPTPWSADWSVVMAKLSGKPVVVTYCNEIVGRGVAGLLARMYNATLLRLLLALSDRIVLISSEGDRAERMASGRYAKKVSVIPPGVDTNRFSPLPGLREPGRVFFLGLLDESHRYKGLSDLLRAMRSVRALVPNARLVVGGQGALRCEYEAQAADLGIAGVVQFVGRVPEEEIVREHNRASVFVLPSTDSRQEGFGIVLAEALACSTPVVTTTAVGLADAIMRAEAGLLVRPGDVAGLARSITRLLEDRSLAAWMGENGRRLVEREYSSAMVNAMYLGLYRSCLER